MKNKLLVGGIFCDLEKAFDCVNQDILLSTFKFYGIETRIFNCINLIWVTDIVEQQYIGCVSESGDFETLFFLIRQQRS